MFMRAEQSIRQIQGLSCQNFRLVAGGSLILYLGLQGPSSKLTEWRLHVDSAWRLDGPDGPLLGSFDTLDCGELGAPETERCLSFLRVVINCRIASVICAPPAGDLTLEFEKGVILRTFSHATAGDAWELRHCSGQRAGVFDGAFREWQEDADE
ncbi:MAG: hypothetical protein NTW03_03130 [Verrucomicrobia bacterium]|nr:hypothetical protein [Verrucomicrobiota bacterium]